jgi:hypothetical protein
MKAWLNTILPILMLAPIAAGCVGAPLSAAEKAVKRTSELSSRFSDFGTSRLRYNPARCDCPEFELLLGDRWHRVVIVNDRDDPVAGALAADAIQAGPGWTTTIRGEIDGVEKKRYRSPVLQVQVMAVCGDNGCGTASDNGQQPAPAAE